jgi:hypothetical protein
MPEYSSLVEYIVKGLVTHPEEVSVETTTDSRGNVKVNIKTARDDIGRVIGKRGATINSIRLLAKASAVKSGDRVDVDIEY